MALRVQGQFVNTRFAEKDALIKKANKLARVTAKHEQFLIRGQTLLLNTIGNV